MRCVYLLQSEAFVGQRHIGTTSDLRQRLKDHNAGKSPHTSKYAPWKLVTYVAFSDEQKAETFERHLKSGSGHAFADKHVGQIQGSLRRHSQCLVARSASITGVILRKKCIIWRDAVRYAIATRLPTALSTLTDYIDSSLADRLAIDF